jgi:hypothetical protein
VRPLGVVPEISCVALDVEGWSKTADWTLEVAMATTAMAATLRRMFLMDM